MTCTGESDGSAEKKKGGRPKEKTEAVPSVEGMYIVCTCMPGELPYTTRVSV